MSGFNASVLGVIIALHVAVAFPSHAWRNTTNPSSTRPSAPSAFGGFQRLFSTEEFYQPSNPNFTCGDGDLVPLPTISATERT